MLGDKCCISSVHTATIPRLQYLKSFRCVNNVHKLNNANELYCPCYPIISLHTSVSMVN